MRRPHEARLERWLRSKKELSVPPYRSVEIPMLSRCISSVVHVQPAFEKLLAPENNRTITDDIFARVMLQCFAASFPMCLSSIALR